MIQEKIDEMLASHALWLEDRTQGKCADFNNTDLRWAHLEGANLREAHLEGANLYKAYLEGANLSWVHLEKANLRWAHLEGAILCLAHLEGAILCLAHLEGADLSEAYLERANLSWAHLEGANLDFTSLPLSCRGLDWYVDKRFAAQLIYHFCRLKCNDEEVIALQNVALPLGNQFHRIETDCVKLKPIYLEQK